MQSAKETASNIAASAKSGMEKTKATLQEKGEKMTTRDPLQKEMATEKKEQRINEAERQKQEIRQHNAATKQATAVGGQATAGHGYSTGGDFSTDHGVTEGGLGSHFPTADTGTGRLHPQDPNMGGAGAGAGTGTGYGSGTTFH